MSRIKNEKDAKAMFGYASSFGTIDLSSMADEKKNLNEKELTEALSDDETKKALEELREKRSGAGKRGRPKKEKHNEETRMTFVVNIEQLEKIREIGYRERVFTKDVLFSALKAYIDDYESIHGEVTPDEKSKIYFGL